MIVEERIYTLHPGKLAEYVGIYQAEGMPIQMKIIGSMLGYFTTEFGPLNQVVHLWGYQSFEERARKRAELQAHPDWKAYLAKTRHLIHSQENKILNPTAFSPIR